MVPEIFAFSCTITARPDVEITNFNSQKNDDQKIIFLFLIIETDQLRKELDEAKSVSQITVMQKDEVIREKTKSYTQLQGEYESL